MKKLFLLLFCLLSVGLLYSQTKKIKVATVGNSLTGATNDFGFYGMALAEMLGDGYEVTKFGKGASGVFIKLREDATTAENPNEYKFAYINSDECRAALAYEPDIVVIKFGANDANKKNFDKYGIEGFKEDYKKLINRFRYLPTHPEVYICLTPPMFYGKGGFMGSFDDDVANEYIRPAVKEIAQELNLKYIDLYTPLKNHKEYMPGGMDWVHPDHRGQYIIAREVFRAITGSFVMNPGGVTVKASDISLTDSGAELKNNAIVLANQDCELSFNVQFGSIPTYEKVELETELNKASSGTFNFYLDNESLPFASVDIPGANKKKNSTLSGFFDRAIKGEHKVKIKWNGQDTKLKSVSVKEKYMPFVNDDETRKYYIVNKATGLVLDCDTAKKVIDVAEFKANKTSQLFNVENLTYHLFRLRAIDAGLHMQNRGDDVIVGKPGDNWRIDDPKYSLFIKPTGDGFFTIELSPDMRIGVSASNQRKVVGNMNDISDMNKWKFIEVGKMRKK